MKIEIIKNPTEQDWLLCKTCTLNTIGKKLKSNTKNVDFDYKVKLLESEHSPIRTLYFLIKMEIPYWVSVHFTRHKIGVDHFVQTQRSDRTGINRNDSPQGELVSHMMYINAQALVTMAHKRLCKQASKETREVMQEIVKQVLKTNPEFKSVLVPNCVYRNGKCTEFFPCKNNNAEDVSIQPVSKQENKSEIQSNELVTKCSLCKTPFTSYSYYQEYCDNCLNEFSDFLVIEEE